MPAQFEGCKLQCLGQPNDYDDPKSLWPITATESDLQQDCEDWGQKFTEVAPERLEAVNGCPMLALESISKGMTLNPITAIQNARIRHKFGIISLSPAEVERIIY